MIRSLKLWCLTGRRSMGDLVYDNCWVLTYVRQYSHGQNNGFSDVRALYIRRKWVLKIGVHVLQKEKKKSASIKGRLSLFEAMYYCCSCYSIVYRFAKMFFFDNGIEIKRWEEMSRFYMLINFNICFCLDILYFESNRKRPHYLPFRYIYMYIYNAFTDH